MAASAMHLASILSPMNLLNPSTKAGQFKAQTTPTTGTGTSTTGGTNALTGSTTGTTFLNLLVKELQNQDPDSPVDSTQMVGQMISLNQLDQLISINQTLSTATTASSGSTTGGSTPVAGATPISSSAEIAQRANLLTSLQNGSAAQAAALSAADPNQTLNLSNLNIPNGGK
jgi:flagellar basal-body rod modification protein FlgD